MALKRSVVGKRQYLESEGKKIIRLKDVTPKRGKPESTEQKKFVSHVSFFYQDLLLFAVPNGGSRHAMEAVNLKLEGVLAGIPDILIDEARNGAFGIRFEFKAPSLKPKTDRAVVGGRSKDQIKIHDHLRRKGYEVHTVYSCDEAIEKLASYMKKPPTIGLVGV